METFTRDSDGATFEPTYLGHPDANLGDAVYADAHRAGQIVIQASPPPLKTIDWDVVAELGLLCECTGQMGVSCIEGTYVGFDFSNLAHCRVLPDQTTNFDGVRGTRDSVLNQLSKAGINWEDQTSITAIGKLTVYGIKPAEGFTFDLNP